MESKLECLWCHSYRIKKVKKGEVRDLYRKEGVDLNETYKDGKISFIHCLDCNLFTWCSKDPENIGEIVNINKESVKVYMERGLQPVARLTLLPSLARKYGTFSQYLSAYKNGEVNIKN